MNGIIIVDKPQDWTSFDVCNKIRHLTGIKKVGHSGTLDPMATGVLPIFLGKATKSIQQFLDGDKGYDGEMTLGVKTDTGDATGKPVMTNDKCSRFAGSRNTLDKYNNESGQMSNKSQIEEIFEKYIGEIEQVPPMYSAKKVNGKPLYKLARKGIEIKREARKIKIYELKLTSPHPQPLSERERGVETISFSVRCSKGTYIRQLVVDIGDDLGCGAHLSELKRVYSHPFKISQAVSMETVVDLYDHGQIESIILQVEDHIKA